ncbi:tetratricopeptide repeat protein [Acaryochloris marina]|uniref:tetratricopeptide repeat protein n=1 Tax=Acaryochloris marina TaxID=155978 RepID=UPI001BAF21FA|nr:tetratricopeptide repeat protein [Acaryochloris marina]QUY45450.1 tetratricopeptide repeat protein [Acaryochloris marina S15]
MRRKSIPACFTVAISTLLVSLSQGVVITNPSLLVTAAPNPLNNPHYAGAISRMEAEDLPGAMREINQAIQLDPSLVDAYMLRGVLHLGQKNVREAIDDFTKVTRLDPNNIEGFMNLAKSQMLLKDYQGALNSATKAKEIDPNNNDAALLASLAQQLLESSQ